MAEAEFTPRDDILRYNLEAFLPYICDCVKATDLLVHLHYFSKGKYLTMDLLIHRFLLENIFLKKCK